jgi:transposase-like protein
MERRQYDREFKVDVVKLSMHEGKKVTEVAAGLGIHENLLYQWRRLYQNNPNNSFLPDPEKEEMKQLKRQLKDAEQERKYCIS